MSVAPYNSFQRKAIQLVVRGQGYGFDYAADVGTVEFQQISPGLARIFLSGYDEGVVIAWHDLPLSISRWPSLLVGAQGIIKMGGDFQITSEESTRTWLASLRTRSLESFIALVRVRSSGLHHSPLAGKVKITLVNGREITRLVPASQVEEIDGNLYIPLWLAKEKAEKDALGGERRLPPRLDRALFKLEQDFEQHLLEMQAASIPWMESERIEAPTRAARLEAEIAAERQLAAKAAQERAIQQETNLREREQKAKNAAEKIFSLPIYAANVTVRGHDWIKNGGHLSKKEWVIEKATVRTSGTRAYIFMEDDAEPLFFKPLKNIEFLQPVTAE